jgi:maleylacetoacetate isomerase
MRLYSYWRSSASYRVRIALALKGLPFETVAIELRRGEQHGVDYRHCNPQGLVPFLDAGEVALGQSLAILEYLDERFPEVPLLPAARRDRALVRQLANIIACDIHPLGNLRVGQYLRERFGADDDAVLAWQRHWIALGFDAIEAQLATLGAEHFCLGPVPTLADVFLIPQVYNARRCQLPLDGYPHICRIDAHCSSLPAFRQAHPDNQPDSAHS